MSDEARRAILEGLNESQRKAVEHGSGPLLIIAGAGSGKTRTLVHRVAWLIESGVPPERILLLTFTRRAAAEMLRRSEHLLRQLRRAGEAQAATSHRVWGGTFHSVAARLLRTYARLIGMDPSFTIHDRSDSEDLLNVLRTELRLDRNDKRFPRKGTCMAIYSHAVNSRRPLEKLLERDYPWCYEYAEELKNLFRLYVQRKETTGVLDYDDLLLFWHGMLHHEEVGRRVRERFDCVLVDEYQDTNPLQGEIVRMLQPAGEGLTVVGDDAQSIYSFRAASVRNILDFPKQFPGTTVVKLEQNYRSTQPILRATNELIAAAREQFEKQLWSEIEAGERPQLVTCQEENEQAEFIAKRILEHREAGVPLRRQAVLFRASQHSTVLEAELAQRNIPFVKYGGLKFLEAAHVKDLMSFLRLADNPRDLVAGMRVLMLLPGIGPKTARRLMDELTERNHSFVGWQETRVPAACEALWRDLVSLLEQLRSLPDQPLATQVARVRHFYGPLVEQIYDYPEPRLADLEQLEVLARRYQDRAEMLSELTLDPPATTQDLAQNPDLDEDYLVLSTIHSAKGLEWDVVYVIHAADGNIPSDMAVRDPEQLEEERRLLYVALTRAKRWLYVCHPLRYYHGARMARADRYGYSQLSRFLDERVTQHFERCVPLQTTRAQLDQEQSERLHEIRDWIRAMWS